MRTEKHIKYLIVLIQVKNTFAEISDSDYVVLFTIFNTKNKNSVFVIASEQVVF